MFNPVIQESMLNQFQQQSKRESFFNDDNQFLNSTDKFALSNNINKQGDDILSNKNSVKNDDVPVWLKNKENKNESKNQQKEDKLQIITNNKQSEGFTIAWPS